MGDPVVANAHSKRLWQRNRWNSKKHSERKPLGPELNPTSHTPAGQTNTPRWPGSKEPRLTTAEVVRRKQPKQAARPRGAASDMEVDCTSLGASSAAEIHGTMTNFPQRQRNHENNGLTEESSRPFRLLPEDPCTGKPCARLGKRRTTSACRAGPLERRCVSHLIARLDSCAPASACP